MALKGRGRSPSALPCVIPALRNSSLEFPQHGSAAGSRETILLPHRPRFALESSPHGKIQRDFSPGEGAVKPQKGGETSDPSSGTKTSRTLSQELSRALTGQEQEGHRGLWHPALQGTRPSHPRARLAALNSAPALGVTFHSSLSRRVYLSESASRHSEQQHSTFKQPKSHFSPRRMPRAPEPGAHKGAAALCGPSSLLELIPALPGILPG